MDHPHVNRRYQAIARLERARAIAIATTVKWLGELRLAGRCVRARKW